METSSLLIKWRPDLAEEMLLVAYREFEHSFEVDFSGPWKTFDFLLRNRVIVEFPEETLLTVPQLDQAHVRVELHRQRRGLLELGVSEPRVQYPLIPAAFPNRLPFEKQQVELFAIKIGHRCLEIGCGEEDDLSNVLRQHLHACRASDRDGPESLLK